MEKSWSQSRHYATAKNSTQNENWNNKSWLLIRPSPVKSSSWKLAHSFDFAQFITIALLLCPQRVFGMCDRRADNFSRGARNHKVAEAPKKRRARSRDLRQAFHGNQERLQTNLAEGHGMARSLERNHL